MKARSTIEKNMTELFTLASNTPDEKRSAEYYAAATALQWVVMNTTWNIKRILSL